jgi:hypothetical protein
MNFYTDPLLNKLREIESRPKFIIEALTPEEQKELDQLARDFGDSEDPEILALQKDYSDVKNSGQAAKPADKKPNYAKPVAGVAEIQAYLNSLGFTDAKGQKLNPDGVWGHRSQEAKDKFDAKFATGSPEDKKYMALLQKVPKDYWYTLIPDAKGTSVKKNMAMKMGKPVDPGVPSGQGGKPTDDPKSKIPATADKKQPYWVDGTRYEYKMSGGGRGQAATGKWEVTATPTDSLQWNSTRARSMSKYTGADADYGKQA